MTLRDRIIDGIIEREGGYVDNPNDSGGPTRYGITQIEARRAGYKGDMRDFPLLVARMIHTNRFWHALRLDEIERLSPAIAEELADTGVNQGVHRAAEFLQRSLNVLNRRAEIYGDIKVDAWVGHRTIDALRAYLQARGAEGETVLLRMLNSLQGNFYVELAERREKDEEFVYGWFLNRVA